MVLELKTADDTTKAEFGSQVSSFKRTVTNLKDDLASLQKQRNKDTLFDSVSDTSRITHISLVEPYIYQT